MHMVLKKTDQLNIPKKFRTTGSFNFFNSETEGNYKNQNFYSKII